MFFKSLDEMISFCEKHRFLCRINRKSIYKMSARFYMKKAGYLNFGKHNVEKMYEELKKISEKHGIRPVNPMYLSVKHPKIAKHVRSKGSKELRDFLIKNNFSL